MKIFCWHFGQVCCIIPCAWLCANIFDCKYVGSETGSFNDDSWTYNPLNRTEEAFQEVKRIFKDILLVAKEANCHVALEGAYGHCMFEPKA